MNKPHQQNLILKIILGEIFCFLILTTIAMFLYTGGNSLNYYESHYNFIKNTFSDLGRTVTYLGYSNLISCLLFSVSMIFVGCTIIIFSLFLSSKFPKKTKGHKYAVLGIITGIISGICAIGIGFTPKNVFPQAHMIFSYSLFLLGLPMSFFYSLSIFMDTKYPNLYGYLFWILLIFLLVYINLIIFGPDESIESGKLILVIGQKIIIYYEIILFGTQAVGLNK